jgi:hypothetical protein
MPCEGRGQEGQCRAEPSEEECEAAQSAGSRRAQGQGSRGNVQCTARGRGRGGGYIPLSHTLLHCSQGHNTTHNTTRTSAYT